MNQVDILIKELKTQGIHNPDVLKAIRSIPREAFVSPNYVAYAYQNTALPIEHEQTISQPSIVALMTQTLIEHGAKHKVLEIGTGSGYQAAILAALFDEVWTIERIPPLQTHAKKVIKKLDIKNIHFKIGDGSLGWKEAAPFDGIIVTAAATEIPEALLAQMDPRLSVMVIPVGQHHHVQKLMLYVQKDRVINKTVLSNVRFVPLISDDIDKTEP